MLGCEILQQVLKITSWVPKLHVGNRSGREVSKSRGTHLSPSTLGRLFKWLPKMFNLFYLQSADQVHFHFTNAFYLGLFLYSVRMV